MSTGKLGQQPTRKISSSKSPGSGILVNKPASNQKLAPPPPPTNGSIESLNNFDKSHPKDDLEIKKHRDESVGRTTSNPKKDKGGKHKKDNSPAVTVAKAPEQTNDSVDAHLNVPLDVVAQTGVIAQKESPKHVANKEKPNKKKRNDAALVQQLGKLQSNLESNEIILLLKGS